MAPVNKAMPPADNPNHGQSEWPSRNDLVRSGATRCGIRMHNPAEMTNRTNPKPRVKMQYVIHRYIARNVCAKPSPLLPVIVATNEMNPIAIEIHLVIARLVAGDTLGKMSFLALFDFSGITIVGSAEFSLLGRTVWMVNRFVCLSAAL